MRVQARSVTGDLQEKEIKPWVVQVPGEILSVQFVKSAPGSRNSDNLTPVAGGNWGFSTGGIGIAPDPTSPLSAPAEFWYVEKEPDSTWTFFQYVMSFPESGDPFYTDGGSWSSISAAASPELAEWPVGITVSASRELITETVTPPAQFQPPSNSHVVIDIEAIYLPTGKPVFLDGIVIK